MTKICHFFLVRPSSVSLFTIIKQIEMTHTTTSALCHCVSFLKFFPYVCVWNVFFFEFLRTERALSSPNFVWNFQSQTFNLSYSSSPFFFSPSFFSSFYSSFSWISSSLLFFSPFIIIIITIITVFNICLVIPLLFILFFLPSLN